MGEAKVRNDLGLAPRPLAEPGVKFEVKACLMDNGELRVYRPEGKECEAVEIMATAITIISRKLAQERNSPLVTLPPGAKLVG